MLLYGPSVWNKHYNNMLFADDTSVFIEGTNFENISKIVTTELEKVNM